MYNIMYETSCQSRFDARYWMLGAGALGRPRGMVTTREVLGLFLVQASWPIELGQGTLLSVVPQGSNLLEMPSSYDINISIPGFRVTQIIHSHISLDKDSHVAMLNLRGTRPYNPYMSLDR